MAARRATLRASVTAIPALGIRETAVRVGQEPPIASTRSFRSALAGEGATASLSPLQTMVDLGQSKVH